MKKNFVKVFYLVVFSLIGNPVIFCQNIGLVNVRYGQKVITVGGTDADLPGFTSKAIQIALDAIKARGGGTVKLSPGTFDITGPVRIPANTTLSGSGHTTILKKCDGFRTGTIEDADYGMLKAVVKDASGFRTGMGIQIYDDKYRWGWDVTTAIITDIQDNVIYFDNITLHDYKSSSNTVISNGCSIIEAVGVENVKIADLCIEGNKSTNDNINGCRGGGIYIHRAQKCIVENVRVNEFNGDAISWQITENITVRGCEVANGDKCGYHPGAGSDHSIIENCISRNNKQDGIFVCWRVQNGIFRNNIIYANGFNGVSTGHEDTDNLFEGNHIYENGKNGVFFRDDNEQNSAHRNTFTGNLIENNGIIEESAGIYIGGETHDTKIINNIFRSTGKGNQSTAIIVGRKSTRVTATGNKISGLKEIVYEK